MFPDSKIAFLLLLATQLAPASAWAAEGATLSDEQVHKIVATLDDRQKNSGDYKALVFIEQKEKDKNDLVYEAVVYRRDEDEKLMILFLKPKAEAGKGYLRLDKNLFMYDPTVGKWERRTERERIAGTDSRRADFDQSRMAIDYTAKYLGVEKLGKFDVHRIELNAKAGVDVAYPVIQLWVDKDTGNMLKQQQLALSGRLMRTSYYPKWEKMFSKSKGADIYFPREIRIFDELEKGNSTTVVIREVDLDSLPANMFTKAWLESKSR